MLNESVIRACYRHPATAFLTLASNKNFSKRGEFLERRCYRLTTQRPDLRHSRVLDIHGEFHRLREKRQEAFPSRINILVYRRQGPSTTQTTAGIPR